MGHDHSYDQLMDYLYDQPFCALMALDENRKDDGIELRYQFGHENGYNRDDIYEYLDCGKPCSVLEVMVGLAQRCENQITLDMDEGARPERWFYPMIQSLGLSHMTNGRLDTEEADEIMVRFLSRRYSYFGEGSLFTVNNPKYDMRKADLWYQAMWYITENSREV